MNKIFKINHQIQNSDKCLYNTTVNIYFSTLVWTEAFYFVYNWFKTNMYVIRYNSAMKSKYYNSSLIFLGFFAGFFFYKKLLFGVFKKYFFKTYLITILCCIARHLSLQLFRQSRSFIFWGGWVINKWPTRSNLYRYDILSTYFNLLMKNFICHIF